MLSLMGLLAPNGTVTAGEMIFDGEDISPIKYKTKKEKKEYEKKTGCAMPKSNYYLKKSSAFSKLAAEYGFEVTVQERTVSITKKSTP